MGKAELLKIGSHTSLNYSNLIFKKRWVMCLISDGAKPRQRVIGLSGIGHIKGAYIRFEDN